MQDKPSLFLSGVLLLSAGVSAIMAARVNGEDLAWLKLLLILLACVTGFYGLVQLVTWIAWTVIDTQAEAARVMREMSEARYPVVLGQTLSNLGPGAVSILERSTTLEVLGIMDDHFNVIYRVRFPGQDVDLDFLYDFIRASAQTKPFLFPVGRAYELGDYPNAEDQAAAITDYLVHVANWADAAAGRNPARLTVPWRQLADKFQLED